MMQMLSNLFLNIENLTDEPVKPIKEIPIIENGESQWTQLSLFA